MTGRESVVREQYATARNLNARQAVWQDDPQRGSPKRAALQMITDRKPRRVLELGCGTGAFAAELAAALPDAEVVPTDASAGMVERAADRGLAAQQVDATNLPYADGTFDVVCAMWMLYHVPDLDRTLAEVARVLSTEGLLVAVTNGDQHAADLRALAGIAPFSSQFSRENGAQSLRQHFATVTTTDFATRAIADHAAAMAYVTSFAPEAAPRTKPFDGERTFVGAVTMFGASKTMPA